MTAAMFWQRAMRIGWTAAALSYAAIAAAAETVALLQNGDLSAWEYRAFDGVAETQYESRRDDALNAFALFADSDAGASGYVRKAPLDLRKTPWLHLQWRVDAAADGFDEKTKNGDDFALRLYFAARDGARYKTLSLVRSGSAARGDSWRSAYAGWLNDLRVYVFAGGDEPDGEWRAAAVNLSELWRELFGEEPPVIGLAGLMTDGDSAGVIMRARYGAIMLSDSPRPPFGE